MSKDPTCTECDDLALRFCKVCQKHFCAGCACIHLPLAVELEFHEVNQTGESNVNDMGLRNREGEAEFEEPKGWWSAANVIASMSTAKLRGAISYHQYMAKVLVSELAARSRGYTSPKQSDIPRECVRGGYRNTYKRSSVPRKVNKAVEVLGIDFVLSYLKERQRDNTKRGS